MEDPDCVVEVDTAKPVVSLTAPSLTDEGVMSVGWTASDEQPARQLDQPVLRPQAGRAVGGDRQRVQERRACTSGRCRPGLTGPVYLRVEAADRAGNVGRYELPTPVALESGKQRVKVIGVGPAQ